MTFLEVYAIGFAVILACMILLWLLSLKLKNSSIVDIFWGTGFVIAAWLYFALSPDGLLARKLLIAILVSVWGLRLSLHILVRNAGKPEDFRYQKWRGENGKKWWWVSFFQVFVLQIGFGHAAVVFQGADRSDNDNCGRLEIRHSAFDVQEFFSAQIRAESGFKDPMINPDLVAKQPGVFADLADEIRAILIDNPIEEITVKDESTNWKQVTTPLVKVLRTIEANKTPAKLPSIADDVRKSFLAELEAGFLRGVLARNAWHRGAAARELGIHVSTLLNKQPDHSHIPPACRIVQSGKSVGILMIDICPPGNQELGGVMGIPSHGPGQHLGSAGGEDVGVEERHGLHGCQPGPDHLGTLTFPMPPWQQAEQVEPQDQQQQPKRQAGCQVNHPIPDSFPPRLLVQQDHDSRGEEE